MTFYKVKALVSALNGQVSLLSMPVSQQAGTGTALGEPSDRELPLRLHGGCLHTQEAEHFQNTNAPKKFLFWEMKDKDKISKLIFELFQQIADARVDRTKIHSLEVILFIAFFTFLVAGRVSMRWKPLQGRGKNGLKM